MIGNFFFEFENEGSELQWSVPQGICFICNWVNIPCTKENGMLTKIGAVSFKKKDEII